MGINRRVLRNNRNYTKKTQIKRIVKDMRECLAIAEDYIPRAKRIEESLERLAYFFENVEENNDRLQDVTSFLDESRSILNNLEQYREYMEGILTDPDATLATVDDRMRALEAINDFFITKMGMIDLHKRFTLHIENEVYKGAM